MMSGLLLGMVLSVCTCWFHNMVTLPSLCWFWYLLIPVYFVQFYPYCLTYLEVYWAHTPCHIFLCIFSLIMWSMLKLFLLLLCRVWAGICPLP
jgi:hypothetical protein